MVEGYINVKGIGYKPKPMNDMTDFEKFEATCEGIWTNNIYGNNYLSDGALRVIDSYHMLLLVQIKEPLK